MIFLTQINKNRRKILVFLLLLSIGVGVFLINNFLTKKGGDSPQKITPTPQKITPTPEDVEFGKLDLISVYPHSGSVKLADTRNSITITFDKIVDVSTVVVKTNPELRLKIQLHPDPLHEGAIILQPYINWQKGVTYQIKILKGVKAQVEALELKDDINIEYKILPIELPNYDRPA